MDIMNNSVKDWCTLLGCAVALYIVSMPTTVSTWIAFVKELINV